MSEEDVKSESSANDTFSELVRTFLLGIVICLFLRGTIAEARFIPSGSMKPTLNIDDRILVEKVTRYFTSKFNRGDIVVFYPPKIETGVVKENNLGQYIPFVPEIPPAFVKRVVGLPGDTVQIDKNSGVYINGKLLEEPYIQHQVDYNLSRLESISGVNMRGDFIRPYAGNSAAITVPEGHLFVLGDNRIASADSHVWGFVDKKRVVGKVCLVFWKKDWLKFF